MSGPTRPSSRPRSGPARPSGGGGGGSGGWLLLAFLLLAMGGLARDPGGAAESLDSPAPSAVASPSASASSSPPPSARPTPTPTPSATPSASPTPSPSAGDTALDFLATLATTAERREGYSRELFRHWVDADGDGCNARYEVLIAESTTTPTIGGGCSLSGGRWVSLYDGAEITDPRTIDIDHMVPLAEAWDSGASAWSAARREAYANDLGDARSLIAVTASSNRAKSDGDPADWLPPLTDYWCTYASEWVAVKARWGLAVDPAERERLVEILEGCPATPISVFPA